MALDTFLNNFIATAVVTLQISDASLGAASDDDPLVRSLAKVAYSQITGYCNRAFEKKVYLEEYHSVLVNDRLKLRNTPITSVDTIWVDDVALILNLDYSVIGNSIKFLKLPRQPGEFLDNYPLSNISSQKGLDVVIKYTGGYAYAEDNNDLFNGLLLQTIALYNRRSTLGMSSISGDSRGNSSISGASDSGDILESVQGILSGLVDFSDVDDV